MFENSHRSYWLGISSRDRTQPQNSGFRFDRTLKIWDLLSGKEIASFSGDAEFDCCAIAPDRVTVVAGDRSGRVHFLRLEGVRSISESANMQNSSNRRI
ncbi:hypothetical protein [Oscillatoria nigro-viridis]|uniref:hypothetical protein n=1 Tax=Phormidium nigroviride TaxID=482564 RepID=UPI0002F982DF|nr:hypothetical protein [Oscillatoria nigro-viridis]